MYSCMQIVQNLYCLSLKVSVHVCCVPGETLRCHFFFFPCSEEQILEVVKQECCPSTVERIQHSALRVGAIWHIFHSSDAGKIRQFIKKVHSDVCASMCVFTCTYLHNMCVDHSVLTICGPFCTDRVWTILY